MKLMMIGALRVVLVNFLLAEDTPKMLSLPFSENQEGVTKYVSL